MQTDPTIVAVIPALDEERSLPLVLGDLPDDLLAGVVVVDNGSRDRTAAVAGELGAVVVSQPERGYGAACLAGVAKAEELGAEILLFLDADYSDFPEEAVLVVAPILRGEAEMVIGSRARGRRESGAMLPHARFGNWLSTRLIRLLWGTRYSDLGPFRAITIEAYRSLGMADRNFGWTVEMQALAARKKLRVAEVPVSYRRRRGVSKISGTLLGSIRAGYTILATILRIALRR